MTQSNPKAQIFQAPPPLWSTLLRVLLTARRRPSPGVGLRAGEWSQPEVLIDPDRVRDYRAVCGFSATDRSIPITFPQLLGFRLLLRFFASADFPWSALGIVHLANDIRSLRPLQEGAQVRVVLRPGELLCHPKGQAFTLHLELSQDNQPVWSCVQVLLKLSRAAAVGPEWSERSWLSVSTMGVHDAAVPELVRTGGFEAPFDIGRRYAPISEDYNPIHLWPWSARLLGVQQPMAHGLWSLARALAGLQDLPAEGRMRLRTVFASPLRLPGQASLWSSWRGDSLQFEVRDPTGERIHLRSVLDRDAAPFHTIQGHS